MNLEMMLLGVPEYSRGFYLCLVFADTSNLSSKLSLVITEVITWVITEDI